MIRTGEQIDTLYLVLTEIHCIVCSSSKTAYHLDAPTFDHFKEQIHVWV